MHWAEYKQLCQNSINILNDFLKQKKANKSLDVGFKEFRIKTSPVGSWKAIYDGDSPISEGFKSWKEVYAFLSGLRRGILQY